MSPLRGGWSSRASTSDEAADTAVVLQAAALCLAYPEQELLERLDLIEAALSGNRAAGRFAPVLDHLRPKPPAGLHPKPPVESVQTPHLQALQSFHVQEFDLSRRHALHLTYWTDGDTRRRGEVLAEFKAVYRDSGLVGDLAGELPDHLPMVLEFAVADPGRGRGLLQRVPGQPGTPADRSRRGPPPVRRGAGSRLRLPAR